MQDLPASASNGNEISGKMDSNTNAKQTASETDSQSALASFQKYLPLVKWVGSSTKDFFVSGQFRQTIRSPIQFVNPRHLSFPQTVGDALTRLAKNWGFYKSNYAIITFLCCFGWLFSSPNSLIVLGILFLVWIYTIKTSNQTLKIGETQYGPMQKYMIAILITLISMLFFGIIGTVVGGLSVGAGISSLHAICHIRPETEHEQLRNLNDIEKDTTNDNININSINNTIYDANTTSVNGLQILQFDDNESFSVNHVSNNNNNNQDIEKMIDTNQVTSSTNNANAATDEEPPELGLQ